MEVQFSTLIYMPVESYEQKVMQVYNLREKDETWIISQHYSYMCAIYISHNVHVMKAQVPKASRLDTSRRVLPNKSS